MNWVTSFHIVPIFNDRIANTNTNTNTHTLLSKCGHCFLYTSWTIDCVCVCVCFLCIVNYLSFYLEYGFPRRTHNWIWTIQRSIDASLLKCTEMHTRTNIAVVPINLDGNKHCTHCTHTHRLYERSRLMVVHEWKRRLRPTIFNYHSPIQLFGAHTSLHASFALSQWNTHSLRLNYSLVNSSDGLCTTTTTTENDCNGLFNSSLYRLL